MLSLNIEHIINLQSFSVKTYLVSGEAWSIQAIQIGLFLVHLKVRKLSDKALELGRKIATFLDSFDALQKYGPEIVAEALRKNVIVAEMWADAHRRTSSEGKTNAKAKSE